ncbi:hypothetical protein KCU96_g24887, partial [Aureobasidium melanogenum]
MAETPRSERSQTRFSTPVSNLDDHRHQQESLPRAHEQGSRRGTLASLAGSPHLAALIAAQQGQGMVARDFENAVVVLVVGDSILKVASNHSLSLLSSN